jgi:hypothetical protein
MALRRHVDGRATLLLLDRHLLNPSDKPVVALTIDSEVCASMAYLRT